LHRKAVVEVGGGGAAKRKCFVIYLFVFVIGASLSEPHIDEFAVEFVYIYVYTR